MVRLNVNENYFQAIDSNEKAYWLGFLYADGSIIYRKGFPDKTVLALKDKAPIEFFKKHINSEHKLGEYAIYDRRTGKTYNRFSLQVTNPIFTKYLYDTGLKGKSNYDTQFPMLKEKYFSHFLRGLFDGDGHIQFTGGIGHHTLSFLATDPIISFIKQFLKEKLNIETGKTHIKAVNLTGTLSYIKIYQWNDLVKLINFLYLNSSPETRLERKYLIADSLIVYRSLVEISKTIYKFEKDGNIFIGKDLKKFSSENNLTVGRLYEVHRGMRSHHKGWKIMTQI